MTDQDLNYSEITSDPRVCLVYGKKIAQGTRVVHRSDRARNLEGLATCAEPKFIEKARLLAGAQRN